MSYKSGKEILEATNVVFSFKNHFTMLELMTHTLRACFEFLLHHFVSNSSPLQLSFLPHIKLITATPLHVVV